MTDTSNPPRRVPPHPFVPHPFVPGPQGPPREGPSGIAARAVAARENVGTSMTGPLDAVVNHIPPTQFPGLVPPPRPSSVGEIAKGIAGVMTEVKTIGKTGFNEFHKYNYVTLNDLLHALTPLMGKHGICIIQNEVSKGEVEGRMAVTYEFSIFHTSGEVWPERPRFTGMSNARDKNGKFDDKSINKCHSAARKYFLLSLFQVPSGDFDDADPGPPPTQPVVDARAAVRARTVPGPTAKAAELSTPHKIVLGPGVGAAGWGSAYLSCIEKAKTADEIREWDGLNNDVLQKLNDDYPDIYNRIDAAVTRRMSQLTPMPQDPQEAMNWIAQHLLDFNTYAAAEAFWNKFVAPNESKFDAVDWGLLIKEWERTELRLNPPEDDPPEAA